MIYLFFPLLYPLHTILDSSCGTPDPDGNIRFPPILNLTAKSLEQNGIYILDNGLTILIWVGPESDPGLSKALFDCEREYVEHVVTPEETIRVRSSENEFARRVLAMIEAFQRFPAKLRRVERSRRDAWWM